MNKLFLFTFISAGITLAIRLTLVWDLELDMHGIGDIMIHIMYVFGPFFAIWIAYLTGCEAKEKLYD